MSAITKVKIGKSEGLKELRLTGLIGREGAVSDEDLQLMVEKKTSGCWVKLVGAKFKDEKSWWIPRHSLKVCKSQIDDCEATDDVTSVEISCEGNVAHIS